ncbi:MAG: hypothetical protein ACTHJ7_07560 [Candidatus Nitrosocosmicus sp.]
MSPVGKWAQLKLSTNIIILNFEEIMIILSMVKFIIGNVYVDYIST